MFGSQDTTMGAETHDSQIVWVFANWLERVTGRPTTPDDQARHRAEGDAV